MMTVSDVDILAQDERVRRSGSFNNPSSVMRVFNRSCDYPPNGYGEILGIRCARLIEQ